MLPWPWGTPSTRRELGESAGERAEGPPLGSPAASSWEPGDWEIHHVQADRAAPGPGTSGARGLPNLRALSVPSSAHAGGGVGRAAVGGDLAPNFSLHAPRSPEAAPRRIQVSPLPKRGARGDRRHGRSPIASRISILPGGSGVGGSPACGGRRAARRGEARGGAAGTDGGAHQPGAGRQAGGRRAQAGRVRGRRSA